MTDELDVEQTGNGQSGMVGAMRNRSPFLAPTERLEADERLDRVVSVLEKPAGTLAQGPARDVLGGRWLGHALHPLLTDFPLGCWISAGLLDLFGGSSSRRAAQRLVGAGLLFTGPTVAAGLSDWGTVTDQRVRRVGAAHAALNGAVALAYARSWMLRRRGHHARGVVWSMAGGSVAWVSGYLGGHLSLYRRVGTGEP